MDWIRGRVKWVLVASMPAWWLASQLENNALSRNLRRVGGGTSSSTPGNCQTHSHQMRGNTERSLGDLYISL